MKKTLHFFFLLITIYCSSQNQISNSEISKKFDSLMNGCEFLKNFELDNRNETINCDTYINKNRATIIRHKYTDDTIHKVFFFYELDNELKYATHSEFVITKSDTLIWESKYYFKNQETFVLNSHGHRYWNTNDFYENEIIIEYKKVN